MFTMNMMKKIVAGLVVMLGIVAPVLAVKVSLDPLYMDARFEPADLLHAGCVNSANLLFQSEGQEIENVHVVFSYLPQDIQIVRVSSTADKSIINYNIDYDSLALNYLNQKGKKLANVTLFQIYFKSQENLTSTVLSLSTGSYALLKNGEKVTLQWDTNLSFSRGLECEPDEVPPVVSLVSPQSNIEKIPLDRHFIFDIKDGGKWVDKKSVEIDFAWEHYLGDSPYFQWNGDYLVFYPKSWLPVNEKLSLEITVLDLQNYGGANTIKKNFSFETTEDMTLMNNISPDIYRKIIGKATNVFASAPECRMLKQMYAEIDGMSQKILDGVFAKLACDLSDLPAFVQKTSLDNVQAASLASLQAQKAERVSVFTVLWWLLFGIVLVLKLHYYFAYRKHKRMVFELQAGKN